jgi:hypothetical protein
MMPTNDYLKLQHCLDESSSLARLPDEAAGSLADERRAFGGRFSLRKIS